MTRTWPASRAKARVSMTQRFAFALLTLTCLTPKTTLALPAFPGAEGWGAETPGGRGIDPQSLPPAVLLVTNTQPSGPGSFMAALMTPGPRIIVFRVSGVINLDAPDYDGFEPNGPYSFVTIAGQTSPGGITFTGRMQAAGSIWWCYGGCITDPFHDGVFRFLRFRGDETNEDAVSLTHSHDFIFDHCDLSGGADETQDLTHSQRFTIQWSTVANSPVCDGCQTYGTIIAYEEVSRITLHHNLWAHHVNRTPLIHWLPTHSPPDNGLIDYRNNLIYDVQIPVWIQAEGPPLVVPLHMNMVGNYYKEGPQGLFGSSPYKIGDAEIYGPNNIIERSGGIVTDTNRMDVATMWPMPAVATHSAEEAYDAVLVKSGAWPRDAMNARTVDEVLTSTGQFGKLDDLLIVSGPAAPTDSDNDGMADVWEAAMGFNSSNASDNVLDQNGDGYLNIEEYINDLAAARLCEPLRNSAGAGALQAILSAWEDTPPCNGAPLPPVPPAAPRNLRVE